VQVLGCAPSRRAARRSCAARVRGTRRAPRPPADCCNACRCRRQKCSDSLAKKPLAVGSARTTSKQASRNTGVPPLSAELRNSSEAVLIAPLRLTFLSVHCPPVLNSSQRVTGPAFRTLGRHAVERRSCGPTPTAASAGPGRRTNAAAHHTLGRQASQEVSTRT
jgi:hypothetical protein